MFVQLETVGASIRTVYGSTAPTCAVSRQRSNIEICHQHQPRRAGVTGSCGWRWGDMTDQLVEDVRRAIGEGGDEIALEGTIGELNPVEWARILSRMSAYEMLPVVHALPTEEVPDIVAELHPTVGAELVERMQRPEAVALLDAMEPDDATDIVAHLD